MRVFLFRMVAAKNSRKRRAALSPASATIAGTIILDRTDPTAFGSLMAGSLVLHKNPPRPSVPSQVGVRI
jgi:hypothetical protein